MPGPLRLVAAVLALTLLGAAGVASGVTEDVARFVLSTAAGDVEVRQAPVVRADGGQVEISARSLELLGSVPADPYGREGGLATIPLPGTTYKVAEVLEWRRRAELGPFRSKGDAWRNSPGDWSRIEANAAAFAAQPRDGRWPGPVPAADRCVERRGPEPETRPATRLRDAAFVHLVTGDPALVEPVRAELLWHATQPGLDFGNRSLWCPESVGDIGPGFGIAIWLSKLLLAYDYLGRDQFTAAEEALLDAWFRDAGRWFAQELDAQLAPMFSVRTISRHELSDRTLRNPYCGEVNWVGGPESCQIHRMHNNRRALMARYVALAGALVDDPGLLDTAKLFVAEYLKFSVFPDGTHGEFIRWRDDLPDLGWAYATQALGPVLTIADVVAREGDASLWGLRTSEGAFGSEGGPKDLRFAATTLGRYLDGTYERHGTDGEPLGDATLIDGVNGSWRALHDLVVVPAARFYRDEYLVSVYRRDGAGMPPYPDRPASVGPHSPFQGESGLLPGVLFMYGLLESQPYPVG